MKKKVILCSLVVIVIIIAAIFFINKINNTTYVLGDYGVEITVPNTYISRKKENITQLLNLYNKNNGIKIGATQLRGDFWKSDEMEDIISEYLKLIFNAYFDSSISNVSTSLVDFQGEKLGKIKMELERPQYEEYKGVLGLVALLIPKSHGYMAIEIYGDTDIITNNLKNIDDILNTIKFSENKHDYSKDVKKELTTEEILEQTKEFLENYYGTMVSGDDLINN